MTLGVISFVGGVVALISSRSAADGMAKGVATHAARENRSRWLDPVFSAGQFLVGFRVIGVAFVLFGIYNVVGFVK